MKLMTILLLVLLGTRMSFAESDVVVEEPPIVIVEVEEEVSEEYAGDLSGLFSFTCTDSFMTLSLNEQFEVSIKQEGEATRSFGLIAPPLVFTDAVTQFDSGLSDKTRVDIFMATEVGSFETEPVMMQMTRMTNAKESELIVSLDNNIFYLECE